MRATTSDSGKTPLQPAFLLENTTKISRFQLATVEPGSTSSLETISHMALLQKTDVATIGILGDWLLTGGRVVSTAAMGAIGALALLQKMACIPILIESSSEQQVILDE